MTESTPATSPTWIRWEKQGRFHAIYVEAGGGYWTYCSWFIRKDAVLERFPDLPYKRARCGCCKTRLRLPYLVPDKLAKIRDEVFAS